MVPDPYSRKAIDDVLSDEEFWVEMGYVFHSRINSVSRRVIQESLRAAQASGTIFDFDSIHPEALRQTLNTSSIWWSRMEETTRNALRIALISWQLGDIRGWGELLDTLEPLFGRDRAKRIATTEVTRIFGLGEVFASESDPMVGGEIWMTAQDEKVCSICGPRHRASWRRSPPGKGTASRQARSLSGWTPSSRSRRSSRPRRTSGRWNCRTRPRGSIWIRTPLS